MHDKRSCLRTYWSVLKRENYIFITFISCNDYNLFYVKIERFFVILCTEMTMNGLFFVHESMHRKYTENEDFTFVQKLPQFIFTILVTDFSKRKFKKRNGGKNYGYFGMHEKKISWIFCGYFFIVFILLVFHFSILRCVSKYTSYFFERLWN